MKRFTGVVLILLTSFLQTSTALQHVHPEAFLSICSTDYGSDNLRNDGISLERLTVRLSGRHLDQVDWRIGVDAVGIDTRNGVEEAWMAMSPSDAFRLTIGQFKVAMGAEYSIPEEELPFIGYSFPAYLSGRSDFGLMADGAVPGNGLFYETSVTVGSGFDENGQDIDGPMLAGKLTAYPWTLQVRPFFSIAYSYTSDFQGELDVPTPRRNKLFDTRNIEAKAQSFYHISWGMDADSVRLLHEFTRGSLHGVDLPESGRSDFDDQISAWAASLSWRIHGKPYNSRPFQDRTIPGHRTGHALEFALRYTNADIDRDLFRTAITDYDTSSQEFRVISGAVNWDAGPWIRLTLQADKTIADQTPRAFSGKDRDLAYTLRMMILY